MLLRSAGVGAGQNGLQGYELTGAPGSAAEEWALADSVEAREQAYKDCEQPVK